MSFVAMTSDVNDLFCDVCGDNMHANGVRVVGIHISVVFPHTRDDVVLMDCVDYGVVPPHDDEGGMVDVPVIGAHPELVKVRDTFGKTDFDVCFTCWLKSLGVRPPGAVIR